MYNILIPLIIMKTRKEYDSIGGINVPVDKYWGASTQRSKKYFDIGEFKVRPTLIKSIAIIKKSAAIIHKNEKQTKDEMLEWVGSFEGRIDDFKTLYENDEVLVGTHSVSAYGDEQASIVMFFATLKGYGKISSWRIHRSFT